MMPSPSTWFTVSSKRCTASIMRCSAGSRRVWAASGSRLRINSVEPLRSATDSDLFALAFQGTSGGEDLLDQIGWGIRQRRWRGGRRYGGAGPDQYCTVFITRQALAHDEFVLQIVELELPFQRAVGQAPPALEHSGRLVENLLKGHRPPTRGR